LKNTNHKELAESGLLEIGSFSQLFLGMSITATRAFCALAFKKVRAHFCSEKHGGVQS